MKKIVDIYKKYEEVINYLIIGGLTTLVSLLIKYALLFTILDASNAIELQIAVIVSWIGACIFAYITNRIIVFKSKNKNIIKEIINFVLSRLSTLLLEMVIMWFTITLLNMNSDTWVIIWTLVTQIIIIVANYILSKLFVFKN